VTGWKDLGVFGSAPSASTFLATNTVVGLMLLGSVGQLSYTTVNASATDYSWKEPTWESSGGKPTNIHMSVSSSRPAFFFPVFLLALQKLYELFFSGPQAPVSCLPTSKVIFSRLSQCCLRIVGMASVPFWTQSRLLVCISSRPRFSRVGFSAHRTAPHLSCLNRKIFTCPLPI
jgi:hypothetical protein